MRPILVTICLVLAYIHGSDAKWREVNNCGTSIYPDAGEGLPLLGRIVEGEDAREYEFPYQVGLWNKNRQVMSCGGVLITVRWFVTAGHCVQGLTDPVAFNDEYEIRIGEFHIDIAGVKEKLRKADKVILHEDYDPSLINDIALVRMNRRVGKAQGRIRPICRPEVGEDYVDEIAIVSGWGDLDFRGDDPDILQYVPLLILSNTECSILYPIPPILSSMVCTSDGATTNVRDSCHGDSGGPVAVKVNGQFQLVGLVSFGIGCASGNPAVNTRVSSFMEWIDSKL